MKTFEWKTDEDIETQSRTIIAKESVTVKEERVEEFTLEQKEQALVATQKVVEAAQKVVADLEAEIEEIKAKLEID